MIDSMGFFANMYYSNSKEDNRKCLSYEIMGIFTDYPDILINVAKKLGLQAGYLS